MLHVGIIGKNNCNTIKRMLEILPFQNNIPPILKFIDLENPPGMKFDIIIYSNGSRESIRRRKRLLPLLKEKNIIIVNTDGTYIFPFYIASGSVLITCGISQKASVTVSSIQMNDSHSKEQLQCCLQRPIPTLSGAYLEPQEFAVHLPQVMPISLVLSVVAAAIVMDLDVTLLNQWALSLSR